MTPGVARLAVARPRSGGLRRPWVGVLPLLVLPILVWTLWLWGTSPWPRWVMMWLFALALFMGAKWLTWWNTPAPSARWRRHLGYLFLWPGLDAAAFLHNDAAGKPVAVTRSEWAAAWGSTALGAALFWGLARQWPPSWFLLQGWTGMVAFIFLAHCGIFHLLSCAWRGGGVEARPLMELPLASRSVAEFWGRRWNTAFRDATHRFLFRPLAQRWGMRPALVAGFFLSGLAHELAVTIPAGGGYGGPTLFFTGQSLAILLERSRPGRALGLGRGGRGWLFTMLALVGPLGLAFPVAFVDNVYLPMMRALGAL